MKALLAKATEDIEKEDLKADSVIQELLSVVTVGEVSNDTFARAKRRCEVGNPPGKKDSLGDGINWEWLLEQEVEFWDGELVIISADGDYESELTKGKPREYLLREWNKKNAGCKLVLEKSLTEFFIARFPDIQLAEEIDKVEEIERLENSSNFATTHKAIAALSKYDDFKDTEIKRIVAAYLENSQVAWILGDEDVKALGSKVVALAKSPDTKEACVALRERLDELNDHDDEPAF